MHVLKTVRQRDYRAEADGAHERLATIEVDGINLGMLADGTLRVLETLVRLVDLRPRQTLLVEEPETGIHPGLLARLLNEFDSLTTSNQLVLSTHSPQVVSWASVDGLRLVDRGDGRTTVRALNRADKVELNAYLEEQGTLGDYFYTGAFDA